MKFKLMEYLPTPFYRQQEMLSLAAFKQLMKNTSQTLWIGSRPLRGAGAC
jgi:hypothetical protein